MCKHMHSRTMAVGFAAVSKALITAWFNVASKGPNTLGTVKAVCFF